MNIKNTYTLYLTNPNTVVALIEDELDAFYKVLFSDEKNYIYQVFFSMLPATGCRIGELCALSRDDIDFSEKMCSVTHGIYRLFVDRNIS